MVIHDLMKRIHETNITENNDITLQCSNGQVHTSKLFLASWSKFWKELLLGFDHSEDVVIVLDINKSVLNKLCKFLGTKSNFSCPSCKKLFKQKRNMNRHHQRCKLKETDNEEISKKAAPKRTKTNNEVIRNKRKQLSKTDTKKPTDNKEKDIAKSSTFANRLKQDIEKPKYEDKEDDFFFGRYGID